MKHIQTSVKFPESCFASFHFFFLGKVKIACVQTALPSGNIGLHTQD